MSYQPLTIKIADKTTLVDMDTEAVPWDNATHTDGISFVNDGRTVLFVKGSTAAGACTVAFNDIPDQYGRGDTASPSVAQGDYAILGPFAPHLWNHDGLVWALPSNTDNTIEYAAVRVANPS